MNFSDTELTDFWSWSFVSFFIFTLSRCLLVCHAPKQLSYSKTNYPRCVCYQTTWCQFDFTSHLYMSQFLSLTPMRKIISRFENFIRFWSSESNFFYFNFFTNIMFFEFFFNLEYFISHWPPPPHSSISQLCFFNLPAARVSTISKLTLFT